MAKKTFNPILDIDIRSAAEAMLLSQGLKSYWSTESLITQRLLIYIAELLEEQNRLLMQRKRFYLPPKRRVRRKTR